MIPIQHTMRQFTIRTRMYSAIAVVLVLLMAVAGVSLYGIEHHRSLAEAHEASSQVQNHHLAQMRSALGEACLHERDMLVMTGDASAVTQAHQQWQQALSRLTALAQQGPSVLGAAGQEALLALSTPLQTYQSGVDAAAKALGTASNPAREWAQQLQAPRAAAEQLGQALDRLGSAMAQQTQDAKAAQAHAMRQTWLLFGAVLLLAIVVVGPLTVLNQRSICRPLDKAEAMAAAIAAGDLSMAVHDQGQDEPAHLLRSLNQMRASLLAMVSNVRTTADSIATASTEIAAGNMDLSTRTENTASSLQSTASSMAQLTGTVHHSAEAAVQANALAQNAAGAAQRGNTIVSAVVANMGEIDSTSKRINDIIGVIDGIAFQTNILALNAAVEAARAGEQGRGFAVVAGEVRSLAQRSASAAREIKQLILASGEKVESGTRLVEDAGAAMSELIAGVQRVSDIIGEISNASREQNDGINQVNVAVTELDQMTQQNAALVEQSAAAAASLQAQARGLTQAMSVFRV